MISEGSAGTTAKVRFYAAISGCGRVTADEAAWYAVPSRVAPGMQADVHSLKIDGDIRTVRFRNDHDSPVLTVAIDCKHEYTKPIPDKYDVGWVPIITSAGGWSEALAAFICNY